MSETSPSKPERPLWHYGAGAAVVALVVYFGGQFALRAFSPHLYSGTVFQDSITAPPLDGLMMDNGEPATLEAFADQVIIIYFGYTNCPDVCPTTLTDVATAIDQLGDDSDRVTLLMITIDPERDDLAFTGEYVRFFHDNFYGVGGSLDDITEVATRYGIYFRKGDIDADGNYDMDHTASLLGIDPGGDLRIIWPPAISPDAMAADLRALLG